MLLHTTHRPLSRAALLACAFFLASCAGQTQTSEDQIVVTGSRNASNEAVLAPPSPPPPPPPPSPSSQMYSRAVGGVVAMPAPQPAPGTVDRDNYENEEANPVRIVADEPVSTFSV
ncbi:MAG TPA: hypothetical protein PKY87_17510, partial [Terricaulis sp.]|nr:hypothetical protein [Terricaulis sp.]